jgi:AcrR family transcriptional regulator
MVTVQRGRPRDAEIERAALTATVALLEEGGYEALRMNDVAARAGIGLGALYRRWSGKQDLVVAALRVGAQEQRAIPGADPVDELVASLLRISAAVHHGLGALVAACLRDPASEIASVAREAKITPMVNRIETQLERCIGPAGDLTARAELGPAFILWHAASSGIAPDEEIIRTRLLPLLGVTGSTQTSE